MLSTQYRQAALGRQVPLVFTSVPAAAAQSLVGQRLIDAGALTVAGDYYCRVEIGGLSALYLHLTATIAAGTATSQATTTYFVANGGLTDATLSAAPYQYQALTTTGALTTTTRQSSSLSATRGEQYLIVKITLATSPNVTFTQAEVNGV